MIAERVLLAVLIGGVAAGCVLVLYPFFSALLWAAILVFTTWPVSEWLRINLRLGHSGAAALMVALTAIVVVLPLGLAAPGGASDVNHLHTVIEDALRGACPMHRCGCSTSPWLGRHSAGCGTAGRPTSPRWASRSSPISASCWRAARPVARHRPWRAAVRPGAVHRVLLLPVRRPDRRADAADPASHRRAQADRLILVTGPRCAASSTASSAPPSCRAS